jgi:hypothetical protein
MMQHKSAMNTEEISGILEPLIRRIIREVLERMLQKEQKMFFLKLMYMGRIQYAPKP